MVGLCIVSGGPCTSLDASLSVTPYVSVSDGSNVLFIVGAFSSVCLSPRGPIILEGCANVDCLGESQGDSGVP